MPFTRWISNCVRVCVYLKWFCVKCLCLWACTRTFGCHQWKESGKILFFFFISISLRDLHFVKVKLMSFANFYGIKISSILEMIRTILTQISSVVLKLILKYWNYSWKFHLQNIEWQFRVFSYFLFSISVFSIFYSVFLYFCISVFLYFLFSIFRKFFSEYPGLWPHYQRGKIRKYKIQKYRNTEIQK